MRHYLDVLRAQGLKITPKRKAIIELFKKRTGKMGPLEVYAELKKKLPQLGIPTVYRILQELNQLGIIVPVVSDDRQLAYSLCTMPEKHHHHFICRQCQKVLEVDYCNFEVIKAYIAKHLKGKVERHMMQIEGLCAECI